MCTVSFVPVKNGYVFTFNRDENPERHTPHFIMQQKLAHKEIYFAKDSKAGGTWFAADSLGNVAMLFNGAYKKHEKEAAYKKSRGIILLELAAAKNMLQYFKEGNFTGIEPFSILMFESQQLYRLVWDGVRRHKTILLKEASYIFSSATLYDEETQRHRRQWLADRMQQQQIDSDALFHFHSHCKKDDTKNGLVIKRPGGCSTLSISQLEITPQATVIKHLDLKTGLQHEHKILLN